MTDISKLKLQGGQIFASTKALQEYVTTGSLPRIHNAMHDAMSFIPIGDRGGAVDFGACHGLLSARARSMGFGPVLGLEYDKASVDAFDEFVKPKIDGVTLIQARIDVLSEGYLEETKSLFAKYSINTVLARRVLSELFCTTYSKKGNGRDVPENVWRAAGAKWAEVMVQAGARHMVLQGRAYGPYKNRATHPICNTDIEVSCVSGSWVEHTRIGDVSYLVPK
jgi:hypothetical protein